MALTCRDAARVSTAALGGHAIEAQRLELEAHLARCPRCSDDHGVMTSLVGGLRAAPPQGLSAPTRAGILRTLGGATAAAAAGRVSRASAARARGPRRAWGFAFAFAGVTLVVGALLGSGTLRPSRWLGLGAGEPPDYRVLSGDVVILQRPAAVPSAGAADDATGDAMRASFAGASPAARFPGPVFRARTGGRIQVADAVVDLGPLTDLGWRADLSRVELLAGRVTVDVQHRRGRHFQVATTRFTVEVVGTRFTVDTRGVETLRGLVRVLGPDGAIVTTVAAGQAWRVPESAAGTSMDVPSPPPAPVVAPMAPAPGASPSTPVSGRRIHAAVAPSASARLANARRFLVRGNAPAARRVVAPMFQLNRDSAVEARALFAESFLIEGRYADAIDAYRIVARDFPGTSQADSAEFAIAQLDSEHGRPADARRELRAYLNRHPRGRFAREAADRLAELEGNSR